MLFGIFGLSEPVSIAIIVAAVCVVVIIILALSLKSSKKPDEKITTTQEKVKTEEVLKPETKKDVEQTKEEVEETKDEETVSVVESEEKEETTPVVESVTEEEPKEEVEETKEEETVSVVESEEKEETTPVVESVMEEEPKEEVEGPKEEPVKEHVEKVDKRYAGKYVILVEGDKYRYRLKASNGEGLIVSEPYSTEKACRTGIETLKKNIEICNVDIQEDKHGLFHFVLRTKQGRILAQSANYKTKIAAEKASESYKRFATTEEVVLDEDSKTHIDCEIFDVEINPETKGKFEVVTEEDGEFHYILKASNGVVICASQSYKSKATCISAIEKFREVVYSGDFKIFKDKNGNYQFKLYNKQNRLVMAGEVYEDKTRCASSIESIKRFAKLAEFVE